MMHVYYQQSETKELHFNIQTSVEITGENLKNLLWLIKQPGSQYKPSFEAELSGEIVEIGPLMNFETTWSSKAVNICREANLYSISRIEYFTRYLLPAGVDRKEFISKNCDRMIEGVYDKMLETFESDISPEPTKVVPFLESGRVSIVEICKKLGLSFNESKLDFLYDYYVNYEKRNPTNVELFAAAQALSEHCRHGFFGAQLYINDGTQRKKMTETLFQIIKSIRTANPGNSNRAFCDNASSIDGFNVKVLESLRPYQSAEMVERKHLIHISNTAETHNYPTSISAFAGAITGIIGMERDKMAEGKGSQGLFSYGGYFVAGLNIPRYYISGEDQWTISARLETPLDILIKGSNGVTDGANKYGQPVICGVCRSVDLVLPDGEKRAYTKPILYAGGVGTIKNIHLEKDEPKVDMKIVQIGGDARRIGKGGGDRSSVFSINVEDYALDFDGVQRGDPEMQNGIYRVNRACTEMNEESPIAVVHDQGAGGPGNVLLEIVGQSGGRIDIRKIRVGDKTMSVLEIVGCEYQERMAYLIYPERFEMFKKICQREGVYGEELGEITGDGCIVFYDSNDDTTPVNLNLEKFMIDLPQEEYELVRVDHGLKPLEIPEDLTIEQAFEIVCQQLSVCSKGFLVRKGDQSVGGLVAQQQCCGPMQIPVSDVAVSAISYLENCGAAEGLGESPLTMLVNPAAGAHMIIAEALLNICAAKVSSIEDITYRANWMAAAKLPGEGAVIHDAIVSLRDLSLKFKIKPDGGKDSLTMAEMIDNVFVKAPATLILSAYCTIPDVRKVVTPDIKRPGESVLILLDPSKGKCRLGGSALAQALDGQLGDECPDIDDPELFLNMLLAILELHEKQLMLAYHDRVGDGGLIVTLAEMAMARNCGMIVTLEQKKDRGAIETLFNQEAGVVIECLLNQAKEVSAVLDLYGVPHEVIASTCKQPHIVICEDEEIIFNKPTGVVRSIWERTSYEIEKIQMPNPECAQQEFALYENMQTPQCKLTFEPKQTLPEILMLGQARPKVAILRTHGTNSDREMTAAFHMSGFATQDVNMFDLKSGAVSLDGFSGIAPSGGFGDADVFGSAKGWAASVLFNESLWGMFEKFRCEPNKFSFWECNGCQFGIMLKWILADIFKDEFQPAMAHNISGRFEHRWPMIEIQKSPAIMFEGMEGSRLVVPSAHGEGRFHFPIQRVLNYVLENNLAPVRYVDPQGNPTEQYPYNPNGSPVGIAALCSPDGRHLLMMPHPTRAFLMYQCQSWMPQDWKKNLQAAPWLQMFQNARNYV
jgi:phosphoribosylformylglycinamidine synthase